MIYDPILHEIWSESCAKLSRDQFTVASTERRAIDCKVVISNEKNLKASCIILPDLCPHLIVHEPTKTDSRFRYLLIGPRSKAIRIDHHDRSRTTVIRLKPGVLSRWLNIAVGEMLDHSKPVNDISPEYHERLGRAFQENHDVKSIMTPVTQYVEHQHLVSSRVWEGLKEYCHSTTRLTVSAAAVYIGTSERNLYKVCKAITGMSAKSVLRIERWTRTLNRTRATQRVNWARVAVEGGYCDQSHMIEDYQRLVGVTPTALFE